jgi:hypothetical protein
LGPVSVVVGANGTWRLIGQILAFLAEDNILFRGAHRIRQGVGFFFGQANNVVSKALGGLGAYSGKLMQLPDQVSQGRSGGRQLVGTHGKT